MLPSLTGGAAGGGSLGNVHGSISLDISSAQQAARAMRDVGQQIDSAMEPATAGLRSFQSQAEQMHPDVAALNAEQFAGNLELISGGARSAAQELNLLDVESQQTSLGMAALDQRTGLVNAKMRELAREVVNNAKSFDQAQAELKEYEAGLAQVEQQTKRTTTPMRDIRLSLLKTTAALAGITFAARRAFSVLEEGAELELTEQRFDRLALSIGTTGDALRDDLQAATSGMVSEAQAMALATDLLGLNLATTSDEAVRMARVVTELDQDLNQLTQALANQSTRRLDQLGVSITVFREKLAGMSDDMTDEEAYRMAFLLAAEEQIDRVGGAADTTAGDIRRLSADWNDLSTDLQRLIVRTLGPALADASGRTAEAFVAQAQAAAESADSIEDIERAHRGLLQTAEELDRNVPLDFAIDPANVELLRVLAQMTDSAEEFERTAVRIFGPSGFTAAIVASGARNAETFYEVATSVDEHTDAMQRNDVVMRRMGAAVGDVAREFENWDKLIRRVNESLDQNARQLSAIEAFEARREGVDSGDLASQIQQEELAEAFELDQERSDSILEWAQEVQAIEDEANAARLEATAQHEARRAQVEADFEQQMLEEEQAFNRQRLRQEQKLEADIQDIRDERARQEAEWFEDLQKSIADAQAQAADDIEELEEEHAERRADIIRESNQSIAEAAGRLDATAVNRLQRERREALEQEQEDYEESRDEIEERLQEFIDRETEAHEERIRRAREADERRIQELRDSLAERQRIEDEDRQIRLDKERAAHAAQLQAMDDAHTARIAQIGVQQGEEEAEYESAFLARMASLGIHHDAWIEEQERAQAEAEEKFEEFWDNMIADIEEAQAEADANAPILGPVPTQGGFNSLQGISGTGGAVAPPTVSQSGDVSVTFADGAIQVNAAQGQDEALIAQEVVGEADTLLEVLRSFA